MSSPHPRGATAEEVERKFSATRAQQLPDLSALPDVAAVDVDTFELSAQYFDTADLLLLRSAITLRRRDGGDDAGWHAKLPAGGDARTELHCPLTTGDTADQLPDELLRLLRAARRGEPVALAALVTTTRTRHRLRDRDGAVRAEVVVDDVTAVRAADDDELQWREIEVELGPGAHGDTGVLDTIERHLADAGIERSPSPSKLHRVLGDLLPPAPATDGPAGYLLDYLARELHTLTMSDIAVRLDADDAVHSMRKAARRLRSAVQTYSEDFDLDRSLIEELRWLGQRLSPARDLEVQQERLAGRVADIPVEAVREPTRARIDEYFTAKSAAARAEAVDTLDSARYTALLRRLDDLVDEIAAAGPGRETRPRPRKKAAAPELTQSVEAVAKKVATRVARIPDAPDTAERDERMHRARKGAKRLRYAIEVITPLHPKRGARALERFDAFQDLLGEFQDSVVAREHLLALVSEQSHSAESSFGLGILHQLETEIGNRQAELVEEAWRKTYKAARRLWT